MSIPVEVVAAVKDLGPHFHFLRKSDRSRISYQKIAVADQNPVTKEELVKGYEYEKGRYVVLTERDFETAAVKRNRRIDLLDFVNAADVDDRYFNKPYYLLPGTGGEVPYALLREALRESGRVGIAKLVLRNQPHLAAVEAIKDALVLSTMRFREELVPVSAFEFPAATVKKPELRMAQQLVEGLASEWDPGKYTDEYRANLMAIIDAKRRHATPALEKQELDADAKVVDLMERLRRSLDQTPPASGRAKPARSGTKGTGRAGAAARQRRTGGGKKAAAGARAGSGHRSGAKRRRAA